MAILRFTFYILPVVFFVGVKSGKFLTMDGDVSRYTVNGKMSTVEDGAMQIMTLNHKRKGQCVRLVVIEVHELEALRVKISCDINMNGYNGKFQFGKAFIFMQEKGNKNFKGLFNLENGNCLLRRYTVTGKPKKLTLAIDMPVTNNDCRDLAKGKNLLNRNIGNSQNFYGNGVGNIQIQGITGGTVSVTNRNDDYVEDSDEESEEDSDEDEEEDYNTYGNSKKPKTATKPTKATKPKISHKPTVTTMPSNVLISHGQSYSPAEDHKAINKETVLALNDVITGFVAVGEWRPVSKGFMSIKTRDFHRGAKECIRLVVITIKGEEADKFKVSCGLFHNVNANGLSAVYGKAFTVKPNRGKNRFMAIFNMKNEFCVKRIYTVNTGNVRPRVVKTKGTKMNLLDAECRALTEGESHSDNSMFSGIGSFDIGGNINMGDTVGSGF